VWATTLFLLGLAAFLRARQKPPLFLLAACAWVAALYGYPIAKLFVPLAGIGFAIAYWPDLRRHLWWVLSAISLGVVLLIPMLAHQASLPDAGRLNEILIFSTGKPAWLPALVMNTLQYIDPLDWLGAQHSAGPLDWLAALIGIPFFFIYVRTAPTMHRMRTFASALLVLSIVPAIVTDSNPNQLRASYLIIFVALFGAWGFTALVDRIPKHVTASPRVRIAVLMSACVFATLGYWWFAQPAYALRQGHARSYMPYTPMAKDIVQLLETKYASVHRVLIVNNNLNQPQVFFQLFRPWPPAALATDIHVTLKEDFWYFTKQLGRYTFCHIDDCPKAGPDGVYVQLAIIPALGATVLDALRLPAPVSDYAWHITHD
jgi:hypothetical protein